MPLYLAVVIEDNEFGICFVAIKTHFSEIAPMNVHRFDCDAYFICGREKGLQT